MSNLRRLLQQALVPLLFAALVLPVACRGADKPVPGNSGTGGRNTDPVRGSGGRAGAMAEPTGTGGVPATPEPGADAPVTPPGDAAVVTPDAVDPEDVGNADAPITCAVACDPGEQCMAGQCVSVCTEGQTQCPTGCADLQIDGANCGGCGMACPAGQFCSVGKCVAACKDGETRCGQSCVSLNANAKNCGACGKACAANEACQNQVCKCADPNKVCGGACTKVANNRTHCGRCNNNCTGDFVCNGNNCGCPGGRRECPNKAGVCVASLNQCCPSGQLWCGGKCVDPKSDKNNCDGCGKVCPGTNVCNASKCECPAGRKSCGGGVCVGEADCCPGQQKCGDGRCIAASACCETCPMGTACTGGKCVGTCQDAGCGTCKKCNGDRTGCVNEDNDKPCGMGGMKCMDGMCKAPPDPCPPGKCNGTCQKCRPSDGMCVPDPGSSCGSPEGGTCNGGGNCACSDGQVNCGGKCIAKCVDPATCDADSKSCKAPPPPPPPPPPPGPGPGPVPAL